MSTPEQHTAWLQSLKPGDEVIVCGSHPGGFVCVDKVERVTKTLVVVRGIRFNRERGRSRGDGWHRRWLAKATPEAVRKSKREAHHRSLVSRLRKTNWENVPFDILVSIDDLVPSVADNGETQR